ncbi:uncharacterized protein NPIL_225551 [Nephila pilipes]|uniref:Uncharacterized protein n=1 Tax=Nephila pilipes TaxID=299642 RepID=A0A8X6UP05_NEPPI|nr:uncharacterized protein NPIL_225551 [Nephila pilipes]
MQTIKKRENRPGEPSAFLTQNHLIRRPTSVGEALSSTEELDLPDLSLCGELLKAAFSCFCLCMTRERRGSQTRVLPSLEMDSTGDNKLVVLGPGGVGKTSLVLQIIEGFFVITYKPTVEDFYRSTIRMPTNQVIRLWDVGNISSISFHNGRLMAQNDTRSEENGIFYWKIAREENNAVRWEKAGVEKCPE